MDMQTRRGCSAKRRCHGCRLARGARFHDQVDMGLLRVYSSPNADYAVSIHAMKRYFHRMDTTNGQHRALQAPDRGLVGHHGAERPRHCLLALKPAAFGFLDAFQGRARDLV